jgi:hypothetical protein
MSNSQSSLTELSDESTSLRDLADLARAGYAVLSQPLMQVTFEVHHVSDRPGYLMKYLQPDRTIDDAGLSPSPRQSFGETLTASADGLGLVIVTRTAVGVGNARQYRSGGLMRCEVVSTPTERIFRGTARPNPNFIYESALKYEGLICVDPTETEVRAWHARAIREIVYEVAKLAHEIKSPILSLQAPAQVPPSELVMSFITPDREEDMLTSAASVAVRFAIAIQHPDAATVLNLSSKLEDYCRRHGFGLWLADNRLGSRPGNWSGVHECNSNLSRATRSVQSASGRYVRRSVPITLVGPARIGATYSLLSFLSQFGNIGIIACSITSLDDLLFIHLELSIVPESSDVLRKADESFDAETASAILPSDALIGLFQLLGLNSPEDHERAGLLVSNAGDYQCLIGPSREIKHGSSRGRMAVWFSWQAQGADLGLAAPLEALYGAFADVGLLEKSQSEIVWGAASPNIEYLICRNMGNSVLRGKGKLSVNRDISLARYPYDAIESRPTNMCVSIEEAWRARSARGDHLGIRELTVAWRECWLGHWSLPL